MHCAFDGKTNFQSLLEQILGNSAIFCKKWLIFRVAQGLAGGMIRDPDLETLGVRFRQKNIMHTNLQG